jgi:hypothetical protein
MKKGSKPMPMKGGMPKGMPKRDMPMKSGKKGGKGC